MPPIQLLILAMVFTVTTFPRIKPINPRCGQKLGLPGLLNLEVQFLTVQLRIWLIQLQSS
nr:glycoside hydrolase family 35 protein [Ipomoea batatas]GMC76029.1 glycoside hydrolase family 35 protein [Ipomoea batatas]GMC77464.1 glycoside hydrolase family 35 protein [Ipomoea batatas]